MDYFTSADNDFIPMMWKQETSPGYESRFMGLYGGGGLPYLIFGGDYQAAGGDTYDSIYHLLKIRNSPMFIDGYLEDLGNDQIRATARFKLVNNLVTVDNKAVFILTNHDGDPSLHSIEIDKSDDIDLVINQIGDEIELEHTFTLNSSWQLENMRVVVLTQSWDEKSILQATELEILDVIDVDFTTEIAFGPPCLEVLFQNRSNTILDLDLVEWDFDGDGIFDSNEDHPVHYYEEIGSYDVTLRITKDGVTEDITKEDYITVTDVTNISGAVGGTWTAENSPYEITEDIIIPQDFNLQIEAGTELQFAEGVQLLVSGTLSAIGSGSEPVIFTSETEWDGIKIIESYNDNVIDYCVISKSTDGAVYIEDSKAVISNNQIIDNSASGNASAIQLVECTEVAVNQNFITRNQNSSYTGGLGFTATTAVVKNNLIVNNDGNLAGALALEEDSIVELINNTISHNTGGAAAFVHTSDLIVQNSLIWQETNLFVQIGCVPEVEYSCLSDNYNGTGNIFSDPEFSNPPEGIGAEYSTIPEDWIYLDTSLCIDAGNPDEFYNDNDDPDNPGSPLYPAMGTLTNDIGIYGGIGFDYELNIVNADYDEIPNAEIELSNYPNPFNPSTTIRFNIDRDELIKLEIFNLKGQIVKELFNGQLSPGHHTKTWNGTDDNNQRVSSGIYFCRLHTVTKARATKLMLIK